MARRKVGSVVGVARGIALAALGAALAACSGASTGASGADTGGTGAGGGGTATGTGAGGATATGAGGAGTGSGGATGTGTGGAASAGGAGGGAVAAVPYCVRGCAAAADCVPAQGGELFGADNYACEAGECRYLGCLSDAECKATFMSDGYACVASSIPGAGAACVATCSTKATCASPGAPTVDEDNWACTGGTCEYLGCQSDEECQSVGQGGAWACDAIPGVSMKVCLEVCATPADCATGGAGLYDESHWDCVAARCQWKGCVTDGECAAAYGGADWVCR